MKYITKRLKHKKKKISLSKTKKIKKIQFNNKTRRRKSNKLINIKRRKTRYAKYLRGGNNEEPDICAICLHRPCRWPGCHTHAQQGILAPGGKYPPFFSAQKLPPIEEDCCANQPRFLTAPWSISKVAENVLADLCLPQCGNLKRNNYPFT